MPEVRIIIRRSYLARQAEISVYIPQNGREHRTGLKVPLAEVDLNVRRLKNQFERSGNTVSVKEM
jgi:hypothetical protein